jgi:hypothetical protein
VLGESRSRFEDQRPRSRDDEDVGDEGDEDMLETADEQQGEPQQQRGRDYEDRGPRRDRPARNDRPERAERPRRFNRDDRDDDRDGNRTVRAERNGAEQFDQDQDEERIAFDVLPPAIGATDDRDAPEAEAEETPRPRRRTAARKPRAETGDDEPAPAA